MTPQITSLKRQIMRGFFMGLETTASLILITFILVAVLGTIFYLTTLTDTTSFRTGATRLASGVQSLSGFNRNYGADSYLDSLRLNNAMPEQWYTCNGGNCTYSTQWGAIAVDGNGTTWTFSIDSVPSDICLNLVTGNMFPTTTSITLNGTETLGTSLGQAAAGTGCDNAANTILWTNR